MEFNSHDAKMELVKLHNAGTITAQEMGVAWHIADDAENDCATKAVASSPLGELLTMADNLSKPNAASALPVYANSAKGQELLVQGGYVINPRGYVVASANSPAVPAKDVVSWERALLIRLLDKEGFGVEKQADGMYAAYQYEEYIGKGFTKAEAWAVAIEFADKTM